MKPTQRNTHQANTPTENELLKSSHVLWLTEKSNHIPPTVKKNFRLFSGFTWTPTPRQQWEENSSQNHPPQLNHPVLSFTWNTLPALRRHKTMFHVKQPNRHKLSEDAICCSTEAYSAAGKNHLHQQAKNKKNMSSSLVFLNLQSPITCGGAE